MSDRHDLRLPDLGLPDAMVSLWLVNVGSEVTEGDRIIEILAGSATIDLPAPASGRLERTLVSEDECVVPGQVLGVIVEEPAS